MDRSGRRKLGDGPERAISFLKGERQIIFEKQLTFSMEPDILIAKSERKEAANMSNMIYHQVLSARVRGIFARICGRVRSV